MKCPAHRLAAELRRSPFPPLWAVTGDEPLLIEEAADAIRTAARQAGFAACDREVIEKGRPLASLLVTTETLSLFSAARLLELRFLDPPSGKEAAEWFAALCARPPVETTTLIILPPLDWSAKRAPWYAQLEQGAILVETHAPTRAQLPQWWAERLRQQQQEASPELLAYFAEMSEGNLLAAKQQLALLALLFPPGPLPEADARAAVTEVARFDPFELRRAVLARNGHRAARLIAALHDEGVAEPLILWALSSAVRALARAAESGDPRRIDPIAREERLFAREEKAALAQGAALDPEVCRAWLQRLATLDRIAKGVEAGDFWCEAERFAWTLSPDTRHTADSSQPLRSVS
ncbi:DNA polymerase III subunit delta [Hydrogenophilus islandicus]